MSSEETPEMSCSHCRSVTSYVIISYRLQKIMNGLQENQLLSTQETRSTGHQNWVYGRCCGGKCQHLCSATNMAFLRKITHWVVGANLPCCFLQKTACLSQSTLHFFVSTQLPCISDDRWDVNVWGLARLKAVKIDVVVVHSIFLLWVRISQTNSVHFFFSISVRRLVSHETHCSSRWAVEMKLPSRRGSLRR